MAIPHPRDGGSIGAEAAAKNCITVGACCSSKNNGDKNVMADFSSYGPIKPHDRNKPDVVAPGTHILSANSSLVLNPNPPNGDKNWRLMDGTSMATPLVAGCVAVLRDALDRRNPSVKNPQAALIKALLINGAHPLGPPLQPTKRFVPRNDSGFGRVKMDDSIVIVEGKNEEAFIEDKVSHDKTSVAIEHIVVKPRYKTLKATLVWSDPPRR